MEIVFDALGQVESFEAHLTDLLSDDGVQGVMVLACDNNQWSASAINPIIESCKKPVFGGLFPQIIHEQQNYAKGTLLIGLPKRPDIICMQGLSDADADYDQQLEPYLEQWDAAEHEATLVVFVDGLSKRISALVQSLFFTFGLEQNFIGGGAGSLSFQQKPCLITPDGLVADVALVARLPLQSGVGVAHGWMPISEGMKVTESDRNVIKTIEWRPAFEVYRELVEANSGQTFTDTNFFDIAKGYPFGIGKFGTEVVVRDPLMTDAEGGMVCVGEVPQGSFVKILKGTPESLLSAANKVRELAEDSIPGEQNGQEMAFFIDCISRVLFLEEGIAEEFAVAAAGRTLFGALTLGEIANNGQDYLEFYNKTAVLGLLR
ncbi:FIST signal transduction protein [Thiomicrospira sp. ALE5]|uniref:FIST signal transduction protein n=1 Tax=Thiomicrospira sp. ALE5 TaxID=748650 RepID=UPI0008E556D8|nr:FIST C-terminal domain-containing protein [Thiomicrospira sp. ALE5]SFR56916.1 FIST N domain-containing protein [Thiomicrospira sp. ALE5]